MNHFAWTARLLGRIARLTLVCLAVGGVVSSVGAQPRQVERKAPLHAKPTACRQLADRLLAVTGSSQALSGAAQISRAQFQNGLETVPNLTEAEKSKLNAAFVRAFDPDRLRARVRSQLVARCDVETYNAVLSALASPLGKKMRELEAQAGTPAGAEALRQYFDRIQAHPPAPERVALIQNLETSRHELELLEQLLSVMARQTAAGFGTPPPTDKDISASLALYLPMAKRMLLIRGLAVYRDSPDGDLVQYSDMWQSAPFQRFNRILGQSFQAALGAGVREAAQAIRPFLGKAPTGPNP